MINISLSTIKAQEQAAVISDHGGFYTIEIINREDKLVTIKGPRGKYVTLPAKDPALLEELKIGEVLVMTYAEALALSLEKVKP